MSIIPPPNNPNVVKATLVFARDTRTFVNTFHFERAGGWTLTTMNTLATDLKNWWNTQYRTSIPPAVALTQVQVRLYDPSLPLAVDLPVSPPIPGTRGTTPDAGNVTLTMSWRTGLAGRAFRGRDYVPSLAEADVADNDTLASVVVTSLSIAAAALIGVFGSSGGHLCVFHRPHSLPHPLDNLFTDVVSYVIESIIDSQRRRLPGRGR